MSNLIAAELDELHGPVTARSSGGLLEIVAGEHTDIFCPPDGNAVTLNAPALLAPAPEGDFVLSAQIESDLRARFDAGALIVWQDEQTWAKLALELSAQSKPTIVSVVTRTRSDDCNSITLERPSAHLRLARIDDTFAFHVHHEGSWELVRHFSLPPGALRPGFLAQSPTGRGCTARFREIVYEPRRLDDIRNGS